MNSKSYSLGLAWKLQKEEQELLVDEFRGLLPVIYMNYQLTDWDFPDGASHRYQIYFTCEYEIGKQIKQQTACPHNILFQFTYWKYWAQLYEIIHGSSET